MLVQPLSDSVYDRDISGSIVWHAGVARGSTGNVAFMLRARYHAADIAFACWSRIAWNFTEGETSCLSGALEYGPRWQYVAATAEYPFKDDDEPDVSALIDEIEDLEVPSWEVCYWKYHG